MTSSINPELTFTLEDAVQDVLSMLTGLDMTYSSSFDRFRTIARNLNRALRLNAAEKDWSYYATLTDVGTCTPGASSVLLTNSQRPRVINDDSVRLVDTDGNIRAWAYFLPRDAIHKYAGRHDGLWVAYTRTELQFSREFYEHEAGWHIHLPVMREPEMFDIPPAPEDEVDVVEAFGPATLAQILDFPSPDLITLRAAYLYAQTDPVMQPRVQTLEAQYKDLMYQMMERDDKVTDSPYLNEFFVPVIGSLGYNGSGMGHPHPHSDGRR